MNARTTRVVGLTALLIVAQSAHAGTFLFAENTAAPTNIIVHLSGYTGTGGTISNTVCLNTAVLPSGATATQVENTIKKVIATWNALRTSTSNYSLTNADLSSTQYDFESTLLHEAGHCIGLGHPNLSSESGLSDPQANSTKSRAGSNGVLNTGSGSDGNYGSKDDSRSDDVNVYWFYPSTNDPMAYPATIDTTTFTQSTASLPSGHTWVANGDRTVLAALGYVNTESVMQQGQYNGEARRRPTPEEVSTLKIAMAGKDGIAGTSDDYTITLVYGGQTTGCTIDVSFSSATAFGVCTASATGLNTQHYEASPTGISFSSTTNWYFSQSANTTTTINSDTPDPSTINSAYAVSVSVARNSAAMTGTPTGSVLVSDGSATCTATLSSGIGSCNLTSTTIGSKTITATYLGFEGFDSSSATTTHTVTNPATVTVTDSVDPTNPGVAYTASFNVSGTSGTPTGTVSVSDGTASCGPVTLASGSGSCSITSITAGSKALTATYGGNSTYTTSTGSTSHTVSYLTPTFTVTDLPDPSAAGTSFTVTATLTGSYTAPSGTVTIDVSDGHGCSIPLSSGTGTCSINTSTLGVLTLTNDYSGDNVYNAAGSSTTHTVKQASTTTISSDTPDPSTVGQAYTVSFAVANTTTPATTPTGSVTVSDGSASCTGTLSSGSGSCSLTSTTTGSKTLTATYAGDTNCVSSSGTATHTVNKGTPTVTVTDPTDPSTVGAAYAANVTVALSGGSTAAGTVTVSDGSATCSITLASGSGTCNVTSTTAGSKTLTANYGGDSNYNSASGTTAHTVSKATPTVTVTDPVDPTTVGSAYSVNVTVAQSGGATVTGSVSVSDGSASCSIASLSSGSGSCSLTSTTAGAKTLTATYNGDGNYNSSSGTTAHTVNTAVPTVTVSDPVDPTIVGNAYAVNVSVAQSGGATATGSVSVSDGSATCSIASLSSGSGSCNLTSTTAGAKTLTATYNGDSNYGSATGTTAHTVNKATPTVTVSDPVDPTLVGSAYTVNVTVVLSGGATVTGSATISDGTDSCPITLSGGAGSCNLTSTTAGSKTLTASYGGDSNYVAANGTTPHTVNSATPTVTVTDPVDPTTVGSAYAVNVSIAQSGGATATGSVSVSDGSATCSIAALSSGAGSCNLTSTTAGSKTLTATYAGDANYNSASGTTAHAVSTATPTVTITADMPDPSTVGSAYTVAVSVTSSAGTPTGSVNVSDATDSCVITLSSGGGSCNLTSTTAGNKTLTANYGGDINFSAASDTTAHTVNQASPTVTITSHLPDPSTVGGSYIVTVSVSGTAGTPTGAISISDGTDSCPITLSAGAGTCNLTSTTAGVKALTASYGGDSNYVAASGTASHTVDMATPTVTITSATPDPSALGTAFLVSVSVTGAGATPTGSVQVQDGADLCSFALSAGNGSCNLSSTVAGTRSISAAYAGDNNYGNATGSTMHTVNQALTVTTILNDTPDPSLIGTPYLVTVSIDQSAATGTIIVSDDTDSCQISVAPPSGTLSCALTSTTAGSKTLTATYSGDGNLQGSSVTAPHTVAPATDRIFQNGFE